MAYNKKQFQVLSVKWAWSKDPIDMWDQAVTVEAYDHEEAAEIWAEEDDCQGEYSIIRDGEHGPILVRLVGENAYKTFTIYAESRAYYSATETK